MRKYLPHYLTAPPSQLHRDLAGDLADLRTRRGVWRNYVAPRGSAKTTWLTKGFGLYCACEGVEPYTLILSDTNDQSLSFLTAIKTELADNPRIAADYPAAAGIGPVWRSNRIVLANGCAVECHGAGGRIRGLTHGAERPSLVIVDDANEKGDAYSPTLRRRKWDWFTKDVMSVGRPGTNFLVAGTPIHREAICHRLKTTAGWQSRTYRSVIRWPDRLDLWEQWERVLTNLSDPSRDDTARQFYESNRKAMDTGAIVLWPERESLYDLMVIRAANGPAAFASEKQDEPGTDGATEFPPAWFDRPGLWFDEWPEELLCRVIALDPSKGSESEPGDWQALVELGLGRNGTIYADCEFRREPTPDMVTRSLDHARRFQPLCFVAETNATMGLLIPEFERQMRERGQLVNLEGLHNSDPKMVRIRGLGGYLSRGQIRIRNTPGGRELVSQLRDVPGGEYDDGPDALATGIRRLELLTAA